MKPIEKWNWSATPMLRLLLPLLFGIGFAIASDGKWQIVAKIVFGLTFLVAIFAHLIQAQSILSFKHRVFAIAVLLNFTALGYWRTVAHDARTDERYFGKLLKNDSAATGEKYEKEYFVAQITDVDERERTFRLRARINNLRINDTVWHATTGSIWLYWKKKTDSTAPPQYPPPMLPRVGDQWLISANLKELEPPKNPETFNYQRYSHFKNINYQAFVSPEDAQWVASRCAPAIVQFADDCKTAFLETLKKYLPTENEYAVGAALLLGENTFGGDEVRNAYVETGAVHILAVSGMHVGLLYFALSFFLRRFSFFRSPRGRWVESGIALFLIVFFALLTGLGGSVLRACAMFGLITIGKSWQRRRNIWNVLAGSLVILLLFDPFLCADVGLQLSFLAVLGIAFFYPRIYKHLFFQNKVFDHAWQITALGLAAQLVVTPISLYYFHRFPAYFWLSGLLLVPLSTVALYVGIALFVVQKIGFDAFTSLIGKILFGFLKSMNIVIFQIQKLPPPSILSEISISLGMMLSFYIILILICLSIWYRRLSFAVFGAGILVLVCANFAFQEFLNRQNRQIIFYHFGKNTLFEIFNEKKCLTFSNNFSDLKKVKMTTENLHILLKIKALTPLLKDSMVVQPNFWWHKGFFAFYGKTGALVDNIPKNVVTLRINTVFVYGNPRLRIADLQQIFGAERYIFDASNAKWRVKKWTAECDSLKIAHHDIAEQGAFVWKF